MSSNKLWVLLWILSVVQSVANDRPYPQATAGIPQAIAFGPDSKIFTYSFAVEATIASNTTEVYIPVLHYPNETSSAVVCTPGYWLKPQVRPTHKQTSLPAAHLLGTWCTLLRGRNVFVGNV